LLKEIAMIRRLVSGEYRLYSRKIDPKTGKRRNLGTFATREAAEKHEREVMEWTPPPYAALDMPKLKRYSTA